MKVNYNAKIGVFNISNHIHFSKNIPNPNAYKYSISVAFYFTVRLVNTISYAHFHLKISQNCHQKYIFRPVNQKTF